MTRLRTAMVALVLVGAACNEKVNQPMSIDGSLDGNPGDMADATTGCVGSISGAVLDAIPVCSLSLGVAFGDQVFQVVPARFVGDGQIMGVAFAFSATGAFTAKTYTLDDVFGGLLVKTVAGASYHAKSDGSGNTSGTMKMVVTSPPSPPAGATQWTDTSMHGTLDGTLPLDPGSSGPAGSQVSVHFRF